MKNKTNSILIFIIAVLLIVACLAFFFIKPSVTGNSVLNNYEGTGYANPVGLFSLQTDIFPLTPENQIVNLKMDVSRIGGYVYKWGWYWNFGINDWTPFELNGNSVEGAPWIVDSSSTSFTINATNRLRSGINFVVTYSCIKNGKEWRCGCENESDSNAECNKWILQMFNVSNVIFNVSQVNPVCTSNYDCVEGVCVSGVCKVLTTPENPENPEGTAISDCQDLQNMKNNLSGNYYLANNIDCSDTINWNEGAGFEPIGSPNSGSFTGNFDGRNYGILNLFIDTVISPRDFVGLFGKSEGNISNIGSLTGNFAAYGSDYVGGLVGYQTSGTITNSYSSIGVTGDSDYVGGLVGYQSDVTINNCFASGMIYGTFYVGGLVGYQSSGIISNSYATGDVYATGDGLEVGGLVGSQSSGIISNSYATGDVYGSLEVGGLVGHQDINGLISNSYAAGGVGGLGVVGGLVGNQYYGTIENSYSMGDVGGSSNIGGFVGYQTGGSISNSYSTGDIAAPSDESGIGGLVGWMEQDSVIVNSFWNIEIINQWSAVTKTCGSTNGGIDCDDSFGKTTAQMKTALTYNSWDTNIWNIVDGSYPTLLKEGGPALPLGESEPSIEVYGFIKWENVPFKDLSGIYTYSKTVPNSEDDTVNDVYYVSEAAYLVYNGKYKGWMLFDYNNVDNQYGAWTGYGKDEYRDVLDLPTRLCLQPAANCGDAEVSIRYS